MSLGAIAAELSKQQIYSPTGKAKWSREAIHKLLSNEKYTGRVLLQKTVRTGSVQVKNEGEEVQYLYMFGDSITHMSFYTDPVQE